MFDTETIAEIDGIANWLGVPRAALLAVAEVESGGRVGVVIKGRLEPLIRFEGHYFDRLLNEEDRAVARKAGLASPRAGTVRNPRRQADRWALLDKAIAINRVAALSSCSWGIGQVMGAHWKRLGFGSADALVELARTGAAGQVKLMARFIAHASLQESLRTQDWATFARRYNGPAYAKNQYDRKMEAAHLRWVERLSQTALPTVGQAVGQALGQAVDPDRPDGEADLMFGARGDSVKRLQRALHRTGYVLVVDGMFGLVTDRTVRQFQRDHLLVANGIVGHHERDLLWPLSVDVQRPLQLLKAGLLTARSRLGATLPKVPFLQSGFHPGARIRTALDCISRHIA